MRDLETIQNEISSVHKEIKDTKNKANPLQDKLKGLIDEKRQVLRETLIGKRFVVRDSFGDGDYSEKYIFVKDKSSEDRQLITDSLVIVYFREKVLRYEVFFDYEINQIELDGLGNHKIISQEEFDSKIQEFVGKVMSNLVMGG